MGNDEVAKGREIHTSCGSTRKSKAHQEKYRMDQHNNLQVKTNPIAEAEATKLTSHDTIVTSKTNNPSNQHPQTMKFGRLWLTAL